MDNQDSLNICLKTKSHCEITDTTTTTTASTHIHTYHTHTNKETHTKITTSTKELKGDNAKSCTFTTERWIRPQEPENQVRVRRRKPFGP